MEECTWCVQNARCHHKDDNYGVCGLQEDSPSQIPGWWGPKGTEIINPDQCREFDRRPGLTFVKYHHPVNYSQPDNVAIINATTVSLPNQKLYEEFQFDSNLCCFSFLKTSSVWIHFCFF